MEVNENCKDYTSDPKKIILNVDDSANKLYLQFSNFIYDDHKTKYII